MAPTNPQSRLPLELCDDIIDLVALYAQVYGSGGVDYGMFEVSDWRFTLVACALTCKAWHHRALYHLHASVWLSTRENVRYLLRRCRAHPDLQSAVRHVIIRGPSQHAQGGLAPFGPIPHFGTFAAMLARHLPRVAYLRICRAAWTAGTLPLESIRCLPVYRTIAQVRLRDVEFKNASQFAALLSALPGLEYVSCTDVSCREHQRVIPFPYPSEARRVRELVVVNVADELVDVLVKLSDVAPAVRKLSHRDWLPMAEPGVSKQCQWLLDAYGEALREVEIISPNGTSPSPSPAQARFQLTTPTSTESLIDLSRQTHLTHLSIDFPTKQYPDFPRVLSILSSLKSETLALAHFRFSVHPAPCASDSLWVWDFLDHLEESPALARLDEVLARANFAGVPEGAVRFEVKVPEEHQRGAARLLRGEDWWAQLLAKRMPRAAGRRVLDCVVCV